MHIEIMIKPASTDQVLTATFDDADEATTWIRSMEYQDAANLDAMEQDNGSL